MTSQALKVISIENSVGIILPQEILEQLRIGKGDTIYLMCDSFFYASVKSIVFIERDCRFAGLRQKPLL